MLPGHRDRKDNVYVRSGASSVTSSEMATVRVGEEPDNVGVGCGAGCEIGSTAVVHSAGDGKALVYVLKSRGFLRWVPF